MAAGGDPLQDHAAFARWQDITVESSGDAAAGGLSGDQDRTPAIKGLL